MNNRLISKKIFFVTFLLLTLLPVVGFCINQDPLKLEISKDSKSIELFAKPPNVDLSLLPAINYDSLYEIWYDPKIEMLIITPDNDNFTKAVTPLKDWKNQKGVKTIILSNFSKYEGKDNAEKIRNMIISFYERENIQWVLLVGDIESNLIPIRYVYNPDVVEVQGESEHSNWDDYYKPTDYYYADLTGTWDENENDKWGESSVKTGSVDEISWTPDVYVGRFPASNATELEVMVNKTLKYETNPNLGDWMGRMLLAGAVSTHAPPEDEARLTQYIWKYQAINEMNFTHLHKTTSSFTPEEPPSPNQQGALTQDNFRTHFNLGYSTIIFAGHGEPENFRDVDYAVYSVSDAISSINNNMPSLIYADACTTSSYDKGDISIGEVLIKKNDSGAIGYIGGLRVNWYFEEDTNLEMLNRGNIKLFWEEFFINNNYQQGKALYESKISYMDSDYFKRGEASMDHEWERKNVLTYNLLGDPEVDIYTNKPVNISNPFTGKIYEGQLLSVMIRDTQGEIVPRARIHLKGSGGKYFTTYADEYGMATFRLLPLENERYQATITGHNVVPSCFSFKTLADEVYPELVSLNCTPQEPTVSDNIYFELEALDTYSGLESAFFLISNDNFKNYTFYRLLNNSQINGNIFNQSINKLDPGVYSFVVVARDFANNMKIFYEENFVIIIPTPLTSYMLLFAPILLLGLISVSAFIVCSGIKKYSKILEILQEKAFP